MRKWYEKSKAFIGRHRRLAAAILAGAVLLVVPVAFALNAAMETPESGREWPGHKTAGREGKDNDANGGEGATDKEERRPPEPSSGSAPDPPFVPPPPSPGSVLGLTDWKLTLPVGAPDEINQPDLATYTSDPYFMLTSAKNGVVFRAHAGGATTSNSGYPRSELREMTNGGKTRASWSNPGGTHTMTIRQAITDVPNAKPEVVAGQIHDDSDDVVMIRLEGAHLFVESDGENIGTLDPAYSLGTVFTVRIEAAAGRIKVWHNGALKVDIARSGNGWYFKAGCYTQSNPGKGDSPDAYGQVIIYSLQVTH